MSLRAVIFGLLAALCIAGLGHMNDDVARLNHFVGNHFPIVVFGPLILVAILGNPLVRLVRRKWALRPAELAIAVTMALAACNIPGSGLLRFFPRSLIMPLHDYTLDTGWQKHHVLRYVTPGMMPGDGPYDTDVMEGVLNGRGRPGEPIGLDRVPWAKYVPVLATWMPMVVLVAVCAICMALVVHRQWSHNERLRYPIAEFAATLASPQSDPAHLGLTDAKGRPQSILHSRLFWAGLGVVFVIHTVNGLHGWFPEKCIHIDLDYDFRAFLSKWPWLRKAQWAGVLANPRIYPTAVAFAFFLAADVSFSIGISQILWVPLAAMCVIEGLPMREDFMTGGLPAWQRFGSYLGVAAMIVYVGRRYYGDVLRAALTGRRAARAQRNVVWAARIGLVAAGGLFAGFLRLGLPWHVAGLMLAMMLMSYVVMARINAESGMVLSQAYWQPTAVLMGLFGAGALGPQALVVSGMLCVMFTIDRRECLMPFMTNSLRLCESEGIRPGRAGRWAMVAFLVALGIGVPVAIWSDYNFGLARGEPWSTNSAPKYTFQTAVRAITDLKLAGQLEESEGYSAWQRVTHADPNPYFLWAAGLGLAAVLVFSVLRLRHIWWPLHPILLVGWGSWAFACFHYSFLLGWLLKILTTRLGGQRTYRQGKAFMIGVIAGDMLGGLLWMVVGAIYFAVTHGIQPIRYPIFPGG